MTALEVMAENVSVLKAVSTLLALGKDHKSPVIKSNVAKIVDTVITRSQTAKITPQWEVSASEEGRDRSTEERERL